LGHSYRSTPLRTSQLFQITTNRLYTLLLQTSERISQHLFDGDLLGSSPRWPRAGLAFGALTSQRGPWHQMLGHLGLGGSVYGIPHSTTIFDFKFIKMSYFFKTTQYFLSTTNINQISFEFQILR
jgi:hypothetical protein